MKLMTHSGMKGRSFSGIMIEKQLHMFDKICVLIIDMEEIYCEKEPDPSPGNDFKLYSKNH